MSLRSMRLAIRALSFDVEGMAEDAAHRRELRRFGKKQRTWWAHENVVGVCIARKQRRGRVGGLCVQVLVRRKMNIDNVPKAHRVPAELKSNAFARPLRTDVRAVGAAWLEYLATEHRPARPGFDLGPSSNTRAGTLGCVVSDKTGVRLGLSCAHVLAPLGQADLEAPVRRALCPSLGRARDLEVVSAAPIGVLKAVRTPGFTDADAATNLDAAVFAPDDPADLAPLVALIDAVPQGVRTAVRVGDAVHKVGAVSGLTTGLVHCVGLTVRIPYGDEIATFQDQIAITKFAEPGDSGSLVLDADNRAVGMHFAAMAGLSICTPIRKVLDAFDCDLASE
jgi:hypothetical protein